MPLYEAQCPRCQAIEYYAETVERRHIVPQCPSCGDKMQKVILSAPAQQLDIAPWDGYISPASGKYITSNRERERDMAETKCRPWEGMEQERKEANRRKEYAKQDLDRASDKAVEAAFTALPESLKALSPE